MKILLIGDYAKKIGGAEIFVYNLKKELEKKGHRTKRLAGHEKENFVSFLSRWYSFKWYQITKMEIRIFKPDLIHINNCSRIISPSPIIAALDSGVPVIMTFHDFHYYCPKTWGIFKDGKPCKYGFGYRCFISNCKCQKEGYFNFPYHWIKAVKIMLHRRILKRSNIKFIAPSKILARNIKRSLGLNVKKINNGFDISNKITNYKKKILFVGRLSLEKGLQTVISKLNEIKDYEVIVLGEGPLKKELEPKYRNIKFLGFQNPADYYKEASILVYPSICQENAPLSILEAASYGLCVIGSNIGGIPEQIQHMKTGLLFKPGDEQDFAKKLDYLLKNPSEIKRMGKNARAFVKENFSWDKIIKQYEKVYAEAINEFKKRNKK